MFWPWICECQGRPCYFQFWIGLQLVPDNKVEGDGEVFRRITKVRDACILLAGHRCFSEYPMDWIVRHLKLSGLNVAETRTQSMLCNHSTIMRQINAGCSKLKFFQMKGMTREMGHIPDS